MNFNYEDSRILNELNYFKSKVNEKIIIKDNESIEYKNLKIIFTKKDIFDKQINILLPKEIVEDHLYNEENRLEEKNSCLFISKIKYEMYEFHLVFEMFLYKIQNTFNLESFVKKNIEHCVKSNKMCKQLKNGNKEDENNIKAFFTYREVSAIQNKFYIYIFYEDTLKNKMLMSKMSCDNCDSDFWEEIFIQISDSIMMLE